MYPIALFREPVSGIISPDTGSLVHKEPNKNLVDDDDAAAAAAVMSL